MTAAARATAAPATAPLLRPEAPLMKTGMVVEAVVQGVVVAAGVEVGTTTLEVVTTQMGVGGTDVVVQGMMTVTVASEQVLAGRSQLVHGVVVVQPTVTHSVAVQVTVAVHQEQVGRVVGW
jgi:hypothetical protein